MFWTGRYLERTQAVARAVQRYQRLSLDLPGTKSLSPLLALVAPDAMPAIDPGDAKAVLRALICDVDNGSSVRGALSRARENLRQGRIVTPREVWSALNTLHGELSALDEASPSDVTRLLDEVVVVGRRIEGEICASMTRDAAYSLLCIGCHLERADMLLRTVGALLPELGPTTERAFADVRSIGLLRVVGAHDMYQRRYHTQVGLREVLTFLVLDASYPLSVTFNLEAVDNELQRLPRPRVVRAALGAAITAATAFAEPQAVAGLEARLSSVLDGLDEVHAAVEASYFPRDRPTVAAPAPTHAKPADGSAGPFEYLAAEHRQLEQALCILDELAAQALCGRDVRREHLRALLTYLADFVEYGHHEKEETILAPMLTAVGFDYFEGPLAAMREDHRREHYFIRILRELAAQGSAWTRADRLRFANVTQELVRFLRSHMEHEQRQLFNAADERLSEGTKATLLSAFVRFDAARQRSFAPARAALDELLPLYARAASLEIEQGARCHADEVS
jgi:uncharacterized alpha-E superfamily protein/hemerythrin-like domain-containing protein